MFTYFILSCLFTLYLGPEVDKVIPKPSARITLLRDPVDLFESGYVYMGLENAYKMNINEFAQLILKQKFRNRKFHCKFIMIQQILRVQSLT